MDRKCRGLFAVLVVLVAATSLAGTGTPGDQKWWLPAGSWCSSPAIGQDGTIYVGVDGQGGADDVRPGLYAVNPDGTVKWVFVTAPLVDNMQRFSSPCLAADGTIYVLTMIPSSVGSDVGLLYAINPDGSQRWCQSMPWDVPVVPSLAIGSDGTVYASTVRGVFYAFQPDGQVKWQVSFALDGSIIVSAAVALDGTIYGYSDSAVLYAFRPDGSIKWSLVTLAPSAHSGLAIGADGTIYVGAFFSLYAVKPDGTVRWTTRLNGCLRSCPVIGMDGTIYARLDDGIDVWLAAIAADGTCKWYFPLLANILDTYQECSPTIGVDGTIYVGTAEADFYAIGLDGACKWHTRCVCVDVTTAPAIGQDGTIYVNTRVALVALTGSAPLANTPWPMAGHDPGHTARTTMPGDIDRDGHVDVADLLAVVTSWGLSFGHAGYDSRCDLDNSGTVDVVDLLTFIENWNK